MEKEALKRIFDFLEEKEEQNPPFLWKHKNNIPLTEKDLNIEGDLDLTDSTLKSLPDNLEVKGDMQTRFSKIEKLPKGLKVGGSLYLSYSNITSLPKGLKVGGYLNLAYSKITSLPEGLEVGENLYIRYTELEQYLDNELREMIKPGVIKGKIYRT